MQSMTIRNTSPDTGRRSARVQQRGKVTGVAEFLDLVDPVGGERGGAHHKRGEGHHIHLACCLKEKKIEDEIAELW